MTIGLTELSRLNFAEAMYEVLFPRAREPRGQTEAMYEFVWKKIVNQELRPGERVLDAAIASEAGVSRTPVREAIQRLVQDELLEDLPRGVRVARPTGENVAHLYDYRCALETFAARRAAGALPLEVVDRLLDEGERLRERLVAPGAQHDPGVAIAFIQYDMGLHQLVLHSGGNPYLSRALAAIHGRLSVFHVAGTRNPNRLLNGIAEHHTILDAMRRGDAAVAGTAMEAHVQRVKHAILSEYFGDSGGGADRRSASTGQK